MADRRSFLKLSAGLGGLVSVVVAGVPSLRAFLSPAFARREDDRWVRLGSIHGFEAGAATRVDFVESVRDAWVETRALRSVWVYTEDNENFTVYSGRCTHLGCAVSFDREAVQFICPCHQGKFEAKTGAVVAGPPPRALDRLESRVEDELLYTAYRTFRLGVVEQVAS